MIFVDIEKAFDSVSWAYMHKALIAAGVGPELRRWIEIMYNPQDPPRRRVRINCEMSDWFDLQSGVAQGAPSSPVLFIFITEAFTRAVTRDRELYPSTGLRGITVNAIQFIISQFADDTTFFLKDWGQLPHMWELLQTTNGVTRQVSGATGTRRKDCGAARHVALRVTM